jgi:hypothetical protein
MIGSFNLAAFLALINSILSTGTAVTAFSLLIYILRYNWRAPVARTFSLLLAGVMIVYVGDAILYHVADPYSAEIWLRAQWIGIALVPAAYLHFADAVLRTTNSFDRVRRYLVYLAYGFGCVFLPLALFGDVVVADGVMLNSAPHLRPGPLFWVYVAYIAATTVAGFIGIVEARRRCLTRTSHRRMTYLLLSSTGPLLAVFPFLLLSSNPDATVPLTSWIALVAGNILIAAMLIVMGYSVAYFGVLAPDRVVKYRLIRFLFRGPITAATIAAFVTFLTRFEAFLGLPGETLTTLAIVFFIVIFQVTRGSLQPFLDVVLFRHDRAELDYIRSLTDRLLTTTDLQQFLENVLTAVADLLRVKRVFLASLDADGQWRLRAHIGSVELFGPALKEMRTTQTQPNEDGPITVDGFWVWPLWARGDEGVLGALAVLARSAAPDLTPDETHSLQTLIRQAAIALEDRRLQQEVFTAVERIMPEIDVIQQQRGVVRYTDSPTQPPPEVTLTANPEFATWLKEALTHYWGGPKLTESPLLKMHIVERALPEYDNDAPKALRAILADAIEQLKPDGQRSLTAAEWVLYNILDLRFIQGRKVREIAPRLAISESDLYRKQKIAVEALAASLSKMEERANCELAMPTERSGNGQHVGESANEGTPALAPERSAGASVGESTLP